MIPYWRFSIRLHKADLPALEEILSGIHEARITALQYGLMKCAVHTSVSAGSVLYNESPEYSSPGILQQWNVDVKVAQSLIGMSYWATVKEWGIFCTLRPLLLSQVQLLPVGVQHPTA